jgi:hypothetical protein
MTLQLTAHTTKQTTIAHQSRTHKTLHRYSTWQKTESRIIEYDTWPQTQFPELLTMSEWRSKHVEFYHQIKSIKSCISLVFIWSLYTKMHGPMNIKYLYYVTCVYCWNSWTVMARDDNHNKRYSFSEQVISNIERCVCLVYATQNFNSLCCVCCIFDSYVM